MVDRIKRGQYRTEEADNKSQERQDSKVRKDSITDSPQFQAIVMAEVLRNDPSAMSYRARAKAKKVTDIINMVINEVEVFNLMNP